MTEAATPSHDLLLEVNNVSVEYLAGNGTVHAVRNVSFALRRGEILGLAGESGSGKSTLAYAIARLLRPPAVITAGEVLYYPRSDEVSTSRKRSKRDAQIFEYILRDARGGIDILTLSPPQLRAFRWSELSIVFQSAMNALNPVMDIGTQITDVLAAHQAGGDIRLRKKAARELLEMVGIAPERLHSYPHELSGGMRQRVVIAIALALKPDLIIMDEPTTALDVIVQREILELISGLCKKMGTSLIFITHDLSLLLELADEVAVMYAGAIVERARRHLLLVHPRHPYTYGLMNSFPTLIGPRQPMTGIPGSPPDLRDLPSGCPFRARCPFAFASCESLVPPLQPAWPALADQQVACHLYNPALTGTDTLPDAVTFAQGYVLKEEGSQTR